MENKKLLEEEKKNKKFNEKNSKLEQKASSKVEQEIQERSKRFLKLRSLATKRRERKEKEKLMRPIREQNRIRKEELRSLSNPPVRPIPEEIGNAVTHGVGALIAVVGFILLLLKSHTSLQYLASIVYGFCMIVMMTMSCLYHAFKAGSKVKRIWRRFDYSSIYLLIGGTFAPIYLIYWGEQVGSWQSTAGIVLFIIQWVFIAIGITFVGVFGPGRFRGLHYTMYFVIGWSGLIFIPDFIQNNLNLLWMILGGGLVYTLGMIPFAKKGMKNTHFIWHFFVLAGATVQFLGILFFIY